jgi:hypothetical protein
VKDPLELHCALSPYVFNLIWEYRSGPLCVCVSLCVFFVLFLWRLKISTVLKIISLVSNWPRYLLWNLSSFMYLIYKGNNVRPSVTRHSTAKAFSMFLLQKHFLCFNTMAEPASNLGNFPRCNWLQRKKKSGAVWFFEAKDLVDQPRIFFFFFLVLTKITFFFF